MSNNFISVDPSLEDYWRGIILFGLNVASYKFALASALLELQPQAGQLVTLDDLAAVYVKHIADHLKKSDKQGTSKSSKFLDAFSSRNEMNVTVENCLPRCRAGVHANIKATYSIIFPHDRLLKFTE